MLSRPRILSRLLLGAGLGAALAPTVGGAQQRPPAPPPRTSPGESSPPARDPRLDLLRGIVLDPRQRAQIDSIEQAFATEARRAEARSTSAGETVARLREHSAERHRAVRSVLTPAQQAVYDRNLAELLAWMRSERHP